MNGNMVQISKLAKMLKKGSPKDLVLQVAKNTNNPIIQQLIEYAEQGRNDKIEEFARNFCKERNIDFDEQFNSMKSMLGLFWK